MKRSARKRERELGKITLCDDLYDRVVKPLGLKSINGRKSLHTLKMGESPHSRNPWGLLIVVVRLALLLSCLTPFHLAVTKMLSQLLAKLAKRLLKVA
jgi:hypothetical protein